MASASASTASQGKGGTANLDKPNASLELYYCMMGIVLAERIHSDCIKFS